MKDLQPAGIHSEEGRGINLIHGAGGGIRNGFTGV